MANYVVLWAIDVEAGSAQEAAVLARASQTREGTIATVFHVSLDAETDTAITRVLDRCLEADSENPVE